MSVDSNPKRRPKSLWLLPALPGILLYAIIYVPALVALFSRSVLTYVPGHPAARPFTLDNFTRFLTDPYYLGLLVDTVRMSALASVIAVVMAYPVAHMLVNSRRLRPFLLPIVAISFFVPALLRLYGWINILGSQGLIHSALLSVGVESDPILFTRTAVVIGLADFAIPFTILTLAGSLNYIHPDIEAAAKNLGATGWQTFLRVTLRLMTPGIVTAFILAFVQSVSAVITPLLLGGGRVPVLATQVYSSMIISVNYPFASATVLIIVIVVGILLGLVSRLGRPRRLSRSGTGEASS